MQHIQYCKTCPTNEKGMVLVVVLLLTAVLVLLGSTAVIMSTTDMKISSNYRSSSQAFYIAEAGLEQARTQLRTAVSGGSTLSQLLAARVGADNALSNSSNIANFYSNGRFVTDDVPYIANTAFGPGSYRVYLTNDALLSDTVTSVTDTNLRLTLTSFGQGVNNSFAVIQSVVKQFTLPPLPGAIVLPGPNVNFQGGNSNASDVYGGTANAITLTSTAAETTVENSLTASGRINNYQCTISGTTATGAPCIANPTTIDPTWTSVGGIEGLYNTLNSIATVHAGSWGASTTIPYSTLGTPTNTQIVVVDGDATIGPGGGNAAQRGTGILVVTGNLTIDGNFNYGGLIMCIGKGKILIDGAGNGQYNGAIFVAQTRDASGNLLSSLGNPTFTRNGSGNSDIYYDSGKLTIPSGQAPFIKLSWKQI